MQIQPASATPSGPSLEALPSQLRAAQRPRSRVQYTDEVVALDPFARNVLWYTVLLLIVSNAGVLAVFALVYAHNDRYDSLLWLLRNFFLFSDGNAFLLSHSTSIAVGYGVLSAIFGVIALRMVVRALAQRQFRGAERLLRLARTTRRISLAGLSRARSGASRSALERPSSFKRSFMRARRAIGVRGPYFELRLLVEEWIELATQTAAAYSASRSISNVPLNVTYAIVIFANSTSSLVYQRVFPASLVKQRLACVMSDLVLDFVWGTLLPVWMYVPVVQRYLRRSTLLDDLTSFTGVTREVERILMLTWKSYAVSVLPFLSTLLKLLDLQNILRDLIPRPRKSANGHVELRTQVRVGRQRLGLLPRMLHALMPVYGLGVLLTSLAANEVFRVTHKQTDIACKYRVHPWFSTEEACLQRQLSCPALGISGSREALTPLLDLFDSSSLSEIFFADCAALEMPTNIHQFEWLMSIIVVNSTIATWGEDAALSDAYFTDLRTVQLFDVVFEEPPVGFTGLAHPVASSLEWVHLEGVDSDRVLPLVGSRWRNLQSFDCLRCGLTSFPDVMYEMPTLSFFSLSFNDISSIPHDWLEQNPLRLQMFWLSNNTKLTTLPDSLWRQAATCGVFSVDHTNLSVVPEWLADVAFPGFQMTATGTPLCNGQVVLSPRLQQLTACTSAY